VTYDPAIDAQGAHELTAAISKRWARAIDAEFQKLAADQRWREEEKKRQEAERSERWEAEKARLKQRDQERQNFTRNNPNEVAFVLKWARDLRRTWGAFGPQKRLMTELMFLSTLNDYEYSLLLDLCRSTDRQVTLKVAQAAKAEGGTDWPEELVTKEITILTERDDDTAKRRNMRGWSAAHSSSGHWCYGALHNYREEAIKLGRTLVIHYVHQLKTELPEIGGQK
jgi:hypothetical protein